jgi:hypothetical protein
MARQLTAPTRRWYDGIPAVAAEIDCGGETHRITWRRGKLVLEDHDLLAERSLTALGAKPPTCVQALDAWRAMRGTELLQEMLLREGTLSREEFASRKASYEAYREGAQEVSAPMRSALKHRPGGAQMLEKLVRQVAERREVEERMWAMTLLEVLPAALRRALALSVVAGMTRHWHDVEFRRTHAKRVESALTAIALPLFERSARRWRRNLKPYARFVAQTWLLAPGEEPTCAAWADSAGARAVLSLPLSWFTDVWAPGIALVDDCLVVGAEEAPKDRTEVRVRALKWERRRREASKSVQAPAVVTRGGDGEWRLRWR